MVAEVHVHCFVHKLSLFSSPYLQTMDSHPFHSLFSPFPTSTHPSFLSFRPATLVFRRPQHFLALWILLLHLENRGFPSTPLIFFFFSLSCLFEFGNFLVTSSSGFPENTWKGKTGELWILGFLFSFGLVWFGLVDRRWSAPPNWVKGVVFGS